MPNTKPDIKSKTGNVNHPFTERDKEVGETIYGTHPARQTSLTGVYNAAQEYEDVRNKVDPYSVSTSYHSNLTQPSATAVPLPTSDVQNFDSGSYTNPTGTTNSDTNKNSNSLSYSFMEDLESGPLSKKQGEHRNKFGFWKRDAASLQHRIDDATTKGKTAKVARLKRKLDNFTKNQKARESGKILDVMNPKNIV